MKKTMITFCLAVLFILPSFPEKYSALAEAAEDPPADAPYGEHIRLITDIATSPMQIEVYDEATGQYASKTVPGSNYIPVDSSDYIQVVCGHSSDSYDICGGEFYVYFYDHEKNVIWDILDHIDERTGERNRVSISYLKELSGFQFYGVPNSSYIRIAKANDYSCQLLIWDGCQSGYPINGQTTVFNDDGEKERLPEDGSASIQVPKSALYLIAKPEYTFINMFTSNTQISEKVPSSECRFPTQVVNLRGFGGAGRAKNIRIVKDYNYKTGDFSRITPNIDLSDAVIAVDESVFLPDSSPNALLNPIYQNIQACMDFCWEAKDDVTDCWGSNGNNGIVGAFRKGVTYHGIPYRSSWSEATSAGWHISKQTFMNAVNDPDSIFYHNPSTSTPGPYYSLVCSSFGTLVSGFAYPMTNFSMMKDPQIQVKRTDYPIIGKLMTNGTGHCFIPIDLSVEKGYSSVLTLAEQIGPVTTIRNIYEGISKKWKGLGQNSNYPSSYVYCVSPIGFSDIPYDIARYSIKNGSARPHRGDQSVYTSAMDVLINIKDTTATRLYFQQFHVTCSHGLPVSISPYGNSHYVNIKPGTKQVVLRSATTGENTFTGASLENGAIYGVWASDGALQKSAPDNVEFFEWYDLSSEKVTYKVTDGALVTDDLFWYATALASSEEDFIFKSKTEGLLTIPYQSPVQRPGASEAHSDYSNYAERAQLDSSDSVYAFFRKGVFGAYVTGMEVVED